MKRRFTRPVLGLGLALALAAGACALVAPSEEEIKAEFAAYVAKANHCQQASDCAEAHPGCPLGCSVPVRADRKADVERKAHDLIADYERGGRSCEYDCAEPGVLACVGQRCAFVEAP
jgi:hypothetical protein